MTSRSHQWWEGDIFRTDTFNSVTTPDYHYRKEHKMILPDNPFSHYGEWKGSDYLSTSTWIWNGTQQVWQLSSENVRRLEAPGIGIEPFSWDLPDNKFLTKVKEASVSVITMFAERKQTASLLTEFAGNILYTMIHWRKPKKVVKRWLKADQKIRKWAMRKLERRILRCTTPAEAWLEYRFAIRPTIGDIKDALEAFEKASKKQVLTHISRKDVVGHTKVQKALGPYGTVVGKLNSRYDWKIVGRFEIVDPSLAALGNLASVSASLVDLVPLSFVVDWAWDISTWLDLQNATLGLNFVSGFKGLKTVHMRTYSNQMKQVSSTKRYIPTDEYNATWTSEYYRRTVLTSCPLPNIRQGRVDEIFGNGHIWDMLALARQIWAGKIKSTYHFSN